MTKTNKSFEVLSLGAKRAWATRRKINPDKWGIPTKSDLKLLAEMSKIHKEVEKSTP